MILAWINRGLGETMFAAGLLVLAAGAQLSCNHRTHSPAENYPARTKERVMKLSFTRSGGFAGPATALKGEVTFEGNSARATSDFGYRRDLAPEEIQTLRSTIMQLPVEQPASRQQPDQYQYDVSITWEDGHVRNLTVHGDGSPGTENLLEWVRHECDRIWTHRTNQ